MTQGIPNAYYINQTPQSDGVYQPSFQQSTDYGQSFQGQPYGSQTQTYYQTLPAPTTYQETQQINASQQPMTQAINMAQQNQANENQRNGQQTFSEPTSSNSELQMFSKQTSSNSGLTNYHSSNAQPSNVNYNYNTPTNQNIQSQSPTNTQSQVQQFSQSQSYTPQPDTQQQQIQQQLQVQQQAQQQQVQRQQTQPQIQQNSNSQFAATTQSPTNSPTQDFPITASQQTQTFTLPNVQGPQSTSPLYSSTKNPPSTIPSAALPTKPQQPQSSISQPQFIQGENNQQQKISSKPNQYQQHVIPSSSSQSPQLQSNLISSSSQSSKVGSTSQSKPSSQNLPQNPSLIPQTASPQNQPNLPQYSSQMSQSNFLQNPSQISQPISQQNQPNLSQNPSLNSPTVLPQNQPSLPQKPQDSQPISLQNQSNLPQYSTQMPQNPSQISQSISPQNQPNLPQYSSQMPQSDLTQTPPQISQPIISPQNQPNLPQYSTQMPQNPSQNSQPISSQVQSNLPQQSSQIPLSVPSQNQPNLPQFLTPTTSNQLQPFQTAPSSYTPQQSTNDNSSNANNALYAGAVDSSQTNLPNTSNMQLEPSNVLQDQDIVIDNHSSNPMDGFGTQVESPNNLTNDVAMDSESIQNASDDIISENTSNSPTTVPPNNISPSEPDIMVNSEPLSTLEDLASQAGATEPETLSTPSTSSENKSFDMSEVISGFQMNDQSYNFNNENSNIAKVDSENLRIYANPNDIHIPKLPPVPPKTNAAVPSGGPTGGLSNPPPMGNPRPYDPRPNGAGDPLGLNPNQQSGPLFNNGQSMFPKPPNWNYPPPQGSLPGNGQKLQIAVPGGASGHRPTGNDGNTYKQFDLSKPQEHTTSWALMSNDYSNRPRPDQPSNGGYYPSGSGNSPVSDPTGMPANFGQNHNQQIFNRPSSNDNALIQNMMTTISEALRAPLSGTQAVFDVTQSNFPGMQVSQQIRMTYAIVQTITQNLRRILNSIVNSMMVSRRRDSRRAKFDCFFSYVPFKAYSNKSTDVFCVVLHKTRYYTIDMSLLTVA